MVVNDKLMQALGKKGFGGGRCRFCGGKHGFVKVSDNEKVHLGLPTFHDDRSGHYGLIAMGCDGCGHIELFFEDDLVKYVGLEEGRDDAGEES